MRPKRHYTPKKNWMNDPNGLVHFKGVYHMYYQYNPYNERWGNMSWGHAVSEDLLTWKELAPAMLPDIPEDMDGCFSGTALPMKDYIMYAYTGVRFKESGYDALGNKVPVSSSTVIPYQIMGRSEDGNTIAKDRESVMEVPADIEPSEFRDPALFRMDERLYMILGAQKQHEGGYVLYTLEDDLWIRRAEHFGPQYGEMLECPSVIDFPGQTYLMYSAMGNGEQRRRDIAVYGSMETDPWGKVTEIQPVDLNDTIYACQCFKDSDGRWLMIGWLRMDTPSRNHSWVGMMSLPRVLESVEGQLVQKPLLGERRMVAIPFGKLQTYSESASYCLQLDLAEGREAVSVDIHVDEHTKWTILITGDQALIEATVEGRFSHYEAIGLKRRLTIVKDAHVVEFFFDDGVNVYTEVYHDEVDDWTVEIHGKKCTAFFGEL